MKSWFSRWGVVLALLSLAILPRLPLLLAPRADLHRSGFQGSRTSTLVGEELHRGTTTHHWLEGSVLALPDYQFVPFHGGPYFTSLVALPLFALGGPKLVLLKATGLFFHAVTLLALFAIARRLAGRRAAWIVALLFAGTPPGYALLNLTAFGTHVEGNACSALLLLAYLRFHERPSFGRAWVLGLAAGSGLFFTYSVGLMLAPLVLHEGFLLLRTRRPRQLLALLGGFTVGFSPWLATNLRSGFSGLSIYGGIGGPIQSMDPALTSPAARIGELLGNDLLRAGYFSAHHWGEAATWTNVAFGLAMAIGALAWTVLRSPRARFDSRCLALAPLLFLMGFAFSNYAIGGRAGEEGPVITYRYLYVLFPLTFLGLALVLDQLARRAPKAAWSGTLLATAMGLAGAFSYVDPGRLGDDWSSPGYDHGAFGRFVAITMVDRPEDVRTCLRRARSTLPEGEFHEMRRGLIKTLRELADLPDGRAAMAVRKEPAKALLAYLGVRHPRDRARPTTASLRLEKSE